MHAAYNRIRGGTVPMLDIKERSLIERIVAREALKFGFVVWLCVRIILSVWGIAATYATSPVYLDKLHDTYPDVVLPATTAHGLSLDIWNVYDTNHYIAIAEQGYESDPGYLPAFFPGFPLMIKGASILFMGDYVLAALIVANVSALIFFWFLYRLVEADYGESIAKRAVVFSAVFPTSFFLFMGYTEAPLLAFTVASLYYARQHKWWLAGILAGAAALVKQPGIFLIVPLAYMYWRQYVTYTAPAPFKLSALIKRWDWAWLLLCPLTALGYTVYRYLFISAPLASANDLGAGETFVLPGIPLLHALQVATPDNPLLLADLMEIGFAVFMIALVIATVVVMRSRTYSIYSILFAIISLGVSVSPSLAVARPETDIPRRALIIFPTYICLAVLTGKRRTFVYAVAGSLLLFLLLSGLFVQWVFIS